MYFQPLSEQALFVRFSDDISEEISLDVLKLIGKIEQNPFEGFVEIVPGYNNCCIYFDAFTILEKNPTAISAIDIVKGYVKNYIANTTEAQTTQGRLIQIPVHYGGENGPDLQYVADYHGLTPAEVVKRHSAKSYLVYMIGFAPGFPYLGGLDETIATPRRDVPRLSIPAGSVGIAGSQTGVYSLSTPGGWQIIGRTDLDLFLKNDNPPTLLRAGDRIQFVPTEDSVLC